LRVFESALSLSLFALRIVALSIVVFKLLAVALGLLSPLEALASSAVALLFYAVLSPALQSRFVFEPLGMWRCAWTAVRLDDSRWQGDFKAGAIIASARASLGSGEAKLAAGELAVDLQECDRFSGAVVVAAAAIEIAAGHPERAARLFESVFELDKKAVSRHVAKLAREFLALSAAERGDWPEAVTHGRAKHGTRVSRFVGDLAARRLGRSAPLLRVRWLLAPNRRAHSQILASVAHASSSSNASPRTPMVFEPPKDAGEGLRCFVAETRSSQASKDNLSRLLAAARSVDADLAFRDRARSRARELGIAAHADEVLARMKSELFAALESRARSADTEFDELREFGALGGEVAKALRDRVLSSAESAFEMLSARHETDKLLPPAEEWNDWLRCVDLFETAAARGGRETRQLLWPVVHKCGCNYGVWLHGKSRYRALGNAIFRYLLKVAEDLDDQSAIALQRSNVEAGI